jgi:hypothetical protein
MTGSLIAFRGFNANNPQHLGWLKRKLANRARYERHRRRASGQTTMRLRPRHLQSRKPALSPWWDRPVVVSRGAITGRPQYSTRRVVFANRLENYYEWIKDGSKLA